MCNVILKSSDRVKTKLETIEKKKIEYWCNKNCKQSEYHTKKKDCLYVLST